MSDTKDKVWRMKDKPAAHVAPWQKKSWPKRESAGSAASLSVHPPQSQPDLHQNMPLGCELNLSAVNLKVDIDLH